MITVVMLDDHQMVREGMKFVLESSGTIQVVGDVGTVEDLKRLLPQQEPDVLILDMILEGVMVGFELVEYMKKEYPQVKILVITMLVEKQYSDRAFELGAIGYLPKREAVSDLIHAVETVAKGKYYISPDTAGQMIHRMVYAKNLLKEDMSVLTSREREIFQELGDGDSNQEIAQKLSISVSTLSTHLENIKRKLNIRSTRELSKKARTFSKGKN
jgi:DNA-binding NarL/FixJ family response regulator